MKKKLAILVCGEFREFESAVKTWFFLNEIEHDFFISTWDKTYEENILLNINIEKNVTKNDILRHIPYAKINIEKFDPISKPHSTLNANKYIYHIRKAFFLMEMEDCTYDMVLVIRPDLAVRDIGDFVKNINIVNDEHIRATGPISFSPAPGVVFLQDVLFYGKYKIMRDCFLSLPFVDTTIRDLHYYLAKHFVYNDIFVVDIGHTIEFFFMRSINKNYLNEDFNYQLEISKYWYDVKYNNYPIDEKINCL